MIKEDNKGKDIKFGKEFEESINRLMQEEIVKRTIEEHVKTDTKNSKDEATLQKLEQKINDKLEDNGYHVKLDDVLNNKDITSNLYDSLERNLNEQIEEKDMKPSKTEVEALTDMISDAAKQENSIHRELKYNGKPLNYRVTEKFVKDIEKMRALNHKASKMKMDRTERNGKSFAPDVEEPVTNINEIVKDIWENAKK